MKTIKKMRLAVAMVLVLAIVAGCGEKTYEPVAIEEGVDRCEVCNMLIKDDQHAVQLIQTDGRVLKFDDIGDLFVWRSEHGTDKIGMEFVRDFYTMDWIPLQDAVFVYDRGFKTPMAYGVYSFKDQESANQLIEEEGTGVLMAPADLETHSWERNKEMMEHMKQEHGMEGGMHGDSGEQMNSDDAESMNMAPSGAQP